MLLRPVAETPADIRRRNRFAVLSLFREHRTLTKSDLVTLTARTGTTITAILDDLVEEGLVMPVDGFEDQRSIDVSRGRPSTRYRLTSKRWLIAGLQIASDYMTGIILSFDGQVLVSKRAAVPALLPTDDVLAAATVLIEELISQALSNSSNQDSPSELLGIGIALEGIVDVQNGVSVSMPYRLRWTDVPVMDYFLRRFGVAVLVDWRVYAAALAEACYGAARGVSDFAYLNVDTGVAVATVTSGMLVRSSKEPAGSTGELSHAITIGGSRLCYCGNTGCLDTEITTLMLVTQLKETLAVGQGRGLGEFWQTHEPSLDNLILAVQENDAVAVQLRDRFAHNLSVAVNSTILLFNSNMVVVGGAAVRFGGTEAMNHVRRSTQRLTVLHKLFGPTQIVQTQLEPDPATVGAAALIIQAVMDGRVAVPQLDQLNQQNEGTINL
jgi:predicted NBD/HSP70 family sugar kinase